MSKPKVTIDLSRYNELIEREKHWDDNHINFTPTFYNHDFDAKTFQLTEDAVEKVIDRLDRILNNYVIFEETEKQKKKRQEGMIHDWIEVLSERLKYKTRKKNDR